MNKIVLFGELMLRLKSFGKERLFQTSNIEAVFGGSEANVAVSLAILGEHPVYVSAFPQNPIGKAAASSLKKYDVDVQAIYKDGRLGIYFLEDGSCQRPSKVTYDRENSCFAVSKPEEYDWKTIFEGAKWFHVSGVTPAVSQSACDCVFEAMKEAKRQGVTVSFDLNYRKKLWKYGKNCKDVMCELAKYADIIIANEEDIQNCLGICLKNKETVNAGYKTLCEDVKAAFPDVKIVAVTLRHSYSADRNGWSCVLSGKTGFYESACYDIENIVERVGAGDSFSAALIYGICNFCDEEEFKKNPSRIENICKEIGIPVSDFNGEQLSLDFATAASCLKHSILGDFNLSEKDEIIRLMMGNSTGRIMR